MLHVNSHLTETCYCVMLYQIHAGLCRRLLVRWYSNNTMLPQHLISNPRCATQIIDVYSYAYSNNVEPFLEPVLGLCHAMMELASRHSDDPSAAILGAFLRHLPSFVSLCGVVEPAVSSSAAACSSVLVRDAPGRGAALAISYPR
jgi:hypothetical protein